MEASLTIYRTFSMSTAASPFGAIPSWLLIALAGIVCIALIVMLGLLVRAIILLARAGRRRDAEQAHYAKSLADQNATLMRLVERLQPVADDRELFDKLRDSVSAAQGSYQAQVGATQQIMRDLSEALRQEAVALERRVDKEKALVQRRDEVIANEQAMFRDLTDTLRNQGAALSDLIDSIQASTATSAHMAQNSVVAGHEMREIAAQLAQMNQQQAALLRELARAQRPTDFNSNTSSQLAPESLARVHFTAYYPDTVKVDTWNGLRVYTHLEEALAAVRDDAAQSKSFLGERPTERSASARGDVRQGDEITIVPDVDDVEFAPHFVTFSWTRHWQSADFNFRLPPRVEGTSKSGTIRIFANGIIMAEIAVSFAAQSQADYVAAQSNTSREPVEVPCRRFQRVFGSYSHKDGRVVLAYRDFCKARGDDFYLDIDTLKPGQRIDDTLKKLIEQAEVFQLFWSKHSARSKNVRTEWVHALGLNRGEGFVLPVYWEKRFVPPPPELPEAWFKYVPLPRLSTRRWLVYKLFGYAG